MKLCLMFLGRKPPYLIMAIEYLNRSLNPIMWYTVTVVVKRKRCRPKAGLSQSVEGLTADREVAGSIPGAGPLPQGLKMTEK